MEFIANNKTRILSFSLIARPSRAEMFHYWQKYLTLQHCEWTCFVKFLFRNYAFAHHYFNFLLCIFPLLLREWLIDCSVYCISTLSQRNLFLHNVFLTFDKFHFDRGRSEVRSYNIRVEPWSQRLRFIEQKVRYLSNATKKTVIKQ